MAESEMRELARAWAKTLAYVNCGKPREADEWAHRLVEMLRERGLLQDMAVRS